MSTSSTSGGCFQPLLDFEDPELRITKACVYVRQITNMSPIGWAARDVWGFFGGKYAQAWFTHFTVAVEFANCSRWILERVDTGVMVAKKDYCMDKPGLPVMHWRAEAGNCKLVARDVHDFLENQRGLGFNLLHRNCKHFAYHFYQDVLRTSPGEFHSWAKQVEYDFLHWEELQPKEEPEYKKVMTDFFI